ncbi:MAG: hypothetical protein N2652_12445 [Kiritimatiellae bacterium]|nr:hypothetical protein [Kiritimatiellia bacterium]
MRSRRPSQKLRPFPAAEVYETLYRVFGPQHWWPGRTPFEVMAGAVLTQSTAWSNVERAIANLRRAGALSAPRILALRVQRLVSLIRPAGYPRVKARRLRALARWLCGRAGGRVASLRRVNPGDLRRELLSIHGIGPETADSILLYALQHPTFVVDAYTRRFMTRHQWAGPAESYDALARRFTTLLPRDTRLYKEYHALVVALGKRWCRPLPRCDDCPLRGLLPGGSSPQAKRQ